MEYPHEVESRHRCYAHIRQRGTMDKIETIKKGLNKKYLRKFKKSCFGNFVKLQMIKFSGQLVHEMISNIVKCNKKYEVWFKVNGLLTRFGLNEFTLITGLKSGPYPSCDSYRAIIKDHSFYKRCFGFKRRVTYRDVEEAFSRCTNMDDRYRLALLICLEGVIRPMDSRKAIDKQIIALTQDDDLFNSYPWGDRAFRVLFQSLKKDWDARSRSVKGLDSYTLHGFPMAIQIWAYEAIPKVGERFATCVGDSLPRMRRWEALKTPKADKVEKLFAKRRLSVYVTLVANGIEKEKDYVSTMQLAEDEADEGLDELVARQVGIQHPPKTDIGTCRRVKKRKRTASETDGRGLDGSRVDSGCRGGQMREWILQVHSLKAKVDALTKLCVRTFRALNVDFEDPITHPTSSKRVCHHDIVDFPFTEMCRDDNVEPAKDDDIDAEVADWILQHELGQDDWEDTIHSDGVLRKALHSRIEENDAEKSKSEQDENQGKDKSPGTDPLQDTEIPDNVDQVQSSSQAEENGESWKDVDLDPRARKSSIRPSSPTPIPRHHHHRRPCYGWIESDEQEFDRNDIMSFPVQTLATQGGA